MQATVNKQDIINVGGWRLVTYVFIVSTALTSAAFIVAYIVTGSQKSKEIRNLRSAQETNNICNENTIDLAIVGAGASGSFSAWQMAKKNIDWKIKLFDANNRVGGRLFSVPIPGINNYVADLGAMRFTVSHTRLQRVISQLGLTVKNFTTPDKHNTLYYLRGHLLNSDDIESGNVFYDMTDYERSISASTQALHDYWNDMILNNASKYQSDRWQRVCTDGKLAYEKGNYNAFGEVGSSEAIEYLAYRCGFIGGYYNNINYAYYSDISVPQDEPVASPYNQVLSIKEGFQELVNRMIHNFLQNNQNRLHLNHKLTSVSYVNGLQRLKFYDTSTHKEVVVCAKKVILGTSAQALKLIQFDEDFQLALAALVDAVKPDPAGKTYLAYDRPWWRNEGQGHIFDKLHKNDVDLKYIVTDTAVGTVLEIDVDDSTGKALLLSYFDWWENIAFWEPYQETGTPHSSSIRTDFEVSEKYITDIHHQFSVIFNISENSIPQPYAAVTQSWFKAPYWTAWHDSSAGYNYPVVIDQIMKPVDNKEIYIVGEAFANNQAWTEGALETAEAVLKQHFGVTEF